MNAQTTTARKEITECPACGKPITAVLSFDLEVGEPEGKDLPVKAKLTGLNVSHDCTPRVMR